MDSRLKIMAVLPFFIIIISVFMIKMIDLERLVLGNEQRQLLNFSPGESEMGIAKPAPAVKHSAVMQANFFSSETAVRDASSLSEKIEHSIPDQPVRRPHQKEDIMPNNPGSDADAYPKLTFVVLNGERSIAIMGDRLLNEGESAGDMTVQRIEKDRVLVKDKSLRWIYMEEDK